MACTFTLFVAKSKRRIGRPTAIGAGVNCCSRPASANGLRRGPSAFRNPCPMSDPLPSDVVVRLKSDPTAALAAALILAGSFPDLVSWVRAFGGSRPSPPTLPKANGKPPTPARANGAGGPVVANGGGPAAAAAKHDQALLALMRANPGASVTEIIRINRRPRNSTMASLERLEKAGLVEHAARGKWTVVPPDDPPPGSSPDLIRGQVAGAETPKAAGWITPLSGKHMARHAASSRVRDEMTLA
jgi:hypothetical protein